MAKNGSKAALSAFFGHRSVLSLRQIVFAYRGEFIRLDFPLWVIKQR